MSSSSDDKSPEDDDEEEQEVAMLPGKRRRGAEEEIRKKGQVWQLYILVGRVVGGGRKVGVRVGGVRLWEGGCTVLIRGLNLQRRPKFFKLFF